MINSKILPHMHVHPSATVYINSLAIQKQAQGEKVYNFAAGDPVYPNHEKIVQAAIKIVEGGKIPYPPTWGVSYLRELAAQWMNNSYDTHYSKENVLITCGGKFGLYAIVQALLEKEDVVLIPTPYWVSYPPIVKLFGASIQLITPKEKTEKITVQDIRESISSHTKMLILNSACNPTGVVYTREELAQILAFAKEHGIIVVSDEVYSGLVYEGPYVSCGSFREHAEHVVVIQSCSKNFGMTGWRVGFVLGPPALIETLAMIQSQSTTGTSLVSQLAAIGALENVEEVNSKLKAAMQKRRDIFISIYNKLFAQQLPPPNAGLYVFAPISSLGVDYYDSQAFCNQLMERGNIMVVPGISFGVEGYVRYAFSEEEQTIEEGLHKLHTICQALKNNYLQPIRK